MGGILPSSFLNKVIVKFELLKNTCAFCACVRDAIIEGFLNNTFGVKQKSRTKRT